MAIIERVFFVAVLAIISYLIVLLNISENPQKALLTPQPRPTPSMAYTHELNKSDLSFSIDEQQELILFTYDGKNAQGDVITATLIVLASGDMIYKHFHGQGVYLYLSVSDKWIYIDSQTKQRYLVRNQDNSYEKIHDDIDQTFDDRDCKKASFRSLQWGGRYNYCAMTIQAATEKFFTSSAKRFISKNNIDKSLDAFMQIFNLQDFLGASVVLTKRWMYNSDNKYLRHLNLTSVKYFERLDLFIKESNLIIPQFDKSQVEFPIEGCLILKC